MEKIRIEKQQARQAENEFVKNCQKLYNEGFEKVLFESYKNLSSQIEICWGKPSYEEAKQCAEAKQRNYDNLELRIQKIYDIIEEGIINCTSQCQVQQAKSNLRCFQSCFKNIEQVVLLTQSKITSLQSDPPLNKPQNSPN